MTIVSGGPVIDSTIGDWFPFNAVSPRQPADAVQRNPRSAQSAWQLEWAEGYRDPGSLQTGYRVELASGPVLEILAPPMALKERVERITGWAATAQEVSALYPVSGEIREPGEVDGVAITLALWEFREDQERMGRYERFRGRVPIEFKGVARVNHEIVVGADVYKVQEALTNTETMTIDLILTKHHG